jgi:hypothetical protein
LRYHPPYSDFHGSTPNVDLYNALMQDISMVECKIFYGRDSMQAVQKGCKRHVDVKIETNYFFYVSMYNLLDKGHFWAVYYKVMSQ